MFLLLITRGYNNSYAISIKLRKEAERSGTSTMTYKNVNRRILLLVQAGVIEEVKYKERVPHGRVDYKLTMKGLEYLIPHFLKHPKEMKQLAEYIEKEGIDKTRLSILLLKQFASAIQALNEYHESTHALYFPFGIRDAHLFKEWSKKHSDVFKDTAMIQDKLLSEINKMAVILRDSEKLTLQLRAELAKTEGESHE